MNIKHSIVIAPVLAALALLAGCQRQQERARYESTSYPERSPEAAARSVPPAPSRGGSFGAVSSFADVVDRVAPAVVTIRSARRVRAPQQFPFYNDPLFRQFFGNRAAPQQQQVQRGLGSGVIVTADGFILTNHHVVDGAEEIAIEFFDRQVRTARLVGSDPPSDLAVLKINQNNLPTIPLGDSDRVRVGDVALAVGNPLGVGQTVTAGIISAKGRATGLSDGSFEDFLQTDAPINQGNSGGALVNTAAELIGINSQILSPTGTNIGIGFAIPANMARSVMDQLVRNGRVRRGQLGISVGPVPTEQARGNTAGVLVAGVGPGTPAAEAGLREGDIITAVDGRPVSDANTLRNRIAASAPGSEVTLSVRRDGRDQQIRARLGEFRAAQR
jgi:Do/DeqQ family serine protease